MIVGQVARQVLIGLFLNSPTAATIGDTTWSVD